MKNIQQLDTNDYIYYFFTDVIEEFTIQTAISHFDVTSWCDIYNLDNGSLICFKQDFPQGFLDLELVSSTTKQIIQMSTYEQVNSIVEENYDPGYGFYVFLDSKEVLNTQSSFNPNTKINNKSLEDSSFIRCDVGRYGPVAFPNELASNPYNYKNFTHIISHSGYGHIMRFDTYDSENKNPMTHVNYTASSTLEGVVKLIDEWAQMASHPFSSTEPIAVFAKLWVENNPIPNSVYNEIIKNQNDTHLFSYIKSGEHCAMAERRQQPLEIFKIFIYKNCLYKTLSCLKNKHPLAPSIPDATLQQERQDAEDTIFKFCYLNGIDVDSVNLNNLKNYIKNHNKLINAHYVMDPLIAIECLL